MSLSGVIGKNLKKYATFCSWIPRLKKNVGLQKDLGK